MLASGGRASRPAREAHARSEQSPERPRLSLWCEWSSRPGKREGNHFGTQRGKAEKSVGSPHPGGHPKLKLWGLGRFGRSLKDLSGGLKVPREHSLRHTVHSLGFYCSFPIRKENPRSPGLRFLGQARRELGCNPKFSVKARQHSGGEIQCRRAEGGGRLASGPILLSLAFMAPDSH